LSNLPAKGLRLPDGARVLLLVAFAASVLAWKVGHTEILFADGLRYINQAQRVQRGEGPSAVRQAVDHPLYPLAVLAAWKGLGLPDNPDGWQLAAQGVAAVSGVLLVLPLYRIARRLFGGSGAWLGVALVYLTPVPTRVLADTLSEATFLLFWSWGVWAALRHLRGGSTRWLAVSMVLGALAYLVRPEGLLLPLAMGATLGLSPFLRVTRLPASRWLRAVGFLAVGGAVTVGPFVAFKGGIATKPAVARLLGLAPPSRPDAVERERPLDPDQTRAQTVGLAARGAFQSVRDALTVPLLPFAALGVGATLRRRWAVDARGWLFLGVVFGGAFLALMRLHATGGYCTPRHALLAALPLFAAAGAGFRTLAAALARAGRRGATRPWFRPAAACLALVAACAAWNAGAVLSPLNQGKGAYRDAGRWLADHTAAGERVVDVTGWSIYYGGRRGYTFADLHEAPGDPAVRWVVVRDAHLTGPWGYCERLRGMVRGATRVARFPDGPRAGASRVSVFEVPRPEASTAAGPGPERH